MTPRTVHPLGEPDEADRAARAVQARREYDRKYYRDKRGAQSKKLRRRRIANEMLAWFDAHPPKNAKDFERVMRLARAEFAVGNFYDSRKTQ
jgi:hypothetical protein